MVTSRYRQLYAEYLRAHIVGLNVGFIVATYHGAGQLAIACFGAAIGHTLYASCCWSRFANGWQPYHNIAFAVLPARVTSAHEVRRLSLLLPCYAYHATPQNATPLICQG